MFFIPPDLSEYFTTDFEDAAYQEAIAGDKFHGAYKQFESQSNSDINKSIKSLEKQVSKHVE